MRIISRRKRKICHEKTLSASKTLICKSAHSLRLRVKQFDGTFFLERNYEDIDFITTAHIVRKPRLTI